MKGCNCHGVREQAKLGDYAFLFEQLDQCEACAYQKEVPAMKRETYDLVRLNYVIAYWEKQRSSAL